MRWIAIALVSCAHAMPPAVSDPCSVANAAVEPSCLEWIVDRGFKAVVYTEYPDRALASYVTRVGQRLAADIHEPITFYLVDDPDPQAEAWSGGRIYVYRGALAVLRSEAELAALLGHELGHVLAGHTSGRHPKELADARDDEIQADELAVRLVAHAGYDPAAVETMMRAISANHPAMCVDTSDPHPCMVERIARLHARIAATPGTHELREAPYRAAIAGLATGVDPRRVAVVGNALVFANAGLGLDAPSGAQVALADGGGKLTLGDDRSIAVFAIPRDLARELHDRPHPGADYILGARGALWILGAEPDVRELAVRVRPIRHDELAALHPTPVDLAAPRALW